MLAEMVSLAFLGGTLTLDRAAGWSFMLSQPLVGACLAAALLAPGSDVELWALRAPIAVGALLQLLLTDASLPAAQRQHETGTAGVVGAAVAVLGMKHLEGAAYGAESGVLWVLAGVGAGLVAALSGGWVARVHRARSSSDLVRAEGLAAAGAVGSFELVYWGGIVRAFVFGAVWVWGASLLGLAALLAFLPRLSAVINGRRAAVVLAALVGVALASAYHAHVQGRKDALRWAALGAAVAFILSAVLSRGAP